MNSLKASGNKTNSPIAGWIPVIASVGIAAGILFAPMPGEAAHLQPASSAAKVVKEKTTAVAVKDVEETGSVEAGDAGDSICSKSRKRLFVEGEGWIVRKLTTCY